MTERTKKTLGRAAVAACVVLHFYTGLRAFFENWYHDYTAWSWTVLGLWLLCWLALDAWLYVFGRAELLRSLKWFWGFSAGMYGVMLLCAWLDWTLPDMAALVFVICSFVTPMHQLLAFSWLLFDELLGLRGSLRFGVEWSAMLAFCLIHFIYIARLHRRAMKKGAPSDGPVDPGAGTVE